jgi:hypothetical protein
MTQHPEQLQPKSFSNATTPVILNEQKIFKMFSDLVILFIHQIK